MTLLDSMRMHSENVLQYENKDLQKRALEIIPVVELEASAIKTMRALQKQAKQNKISKEAIPEIRDILLTKLLTWFKECFFTWIDTPKCKFCGGTTTFFSTTKSNNRKYASKVEVFECVFCNEKTEFVRYNDPWRLLETRKGRCGEWANCFTLLCRAMGWDARHVVDVTDHVWTEVYSIGQGRWLHCDPCENICDNPLVYEEGWGKKLSYVIAYSYDDVQDVTWRYTRDHKEVLGRRNECSESDLLQRIITLRDERQRSLSKNRINYVTRRLVVELVELMNPPKLGDKGYEGRTSGALLWRTSRGEAGTSRPIKGYVWHPTEEEIQERAMHIMYSCVQDAYIRPVGKGETIEHWEEGVYEAASVFRKEEKDWKVVYLARKEGHDEGFVTWKVDCGESGLVVDALKLCCKSTIFQSGQVHLKLCAGDSFFETKELSGCTSFTLSVHLSGGDGNVAWQHAQLFRQSIKDQTDYPLSIAVTLKQ